MSDSQLTARDVDRLVKDPSADMRIKTTEKVVRQLEGGAFSDEERTIAFGIFRVLAEDAEVRVRAALSKSLKSNHEIPRELALKLAADVEAVATPILEVSRLFTDDDLMAIIEKRNESKQQAIARRKTVSDAVSGSLIKNGTVSVASILVANPGATISESNLLGVVDRFGKEERVQQPLIRRASLPVTVTERLVALVSDSLREELLERHHVSPDVAAKLALQSRERATVGLAWDTADSELRSLVTQMNTHDRLTASVILRAVCMGQIRFFEHALAVRSALPLENVRKLVHDGGQSGLASVYKKSQLPEEHVELAAVAVELADTLPLDGESQDEERFVRRVIERLLSQSDSLEANFEHEDLDYLLNQVSKLPAASTAQH